MVRKLALAVSIAMGTLPLSVYGLGLGHIHTKSTLNENFSGQIDLLSVPKGELDGLKVELASMDAFARAGVDRPFLLSKLKFEPIRLKSGKAAIRVTSVAPITEPFLDFLIELNWANGRLIKEYTVLLDPPATTKRSAPGVTTASASNVATAPARRPRQLGGTVSGNEYGVVAGDTLWEIADSLRPQGVSVHQMMMALQQANPSAFIRGNVNLLKKGAILRVPDIDEAVSLGQQEALISFQNQTQDWMTSAPATGDDAASSTGEMADTAGQTDTDENTSRLKIAAPSGDEISGGESASSGDAAVEDLSRELILSQEEAETARLETDELKGQVNTLEERVDDMQRLLTLKDEQLAQLQAGVNAEEFTSEDSETGVAFEDLAEIETQEALEAGADEAIEINIVEEEPAEVESVIVEQLESADAESASEPSTPSWLEDNKWMLAGIGGGALGIALLAWLFGRRKEEDFTSTSIDEESILMDDVRSVATAPGEQAGSHDDTSFLSEYSTEDLKALQEDTAEVDPVSEADVYVAYGRYQQALGILQEALSNEGADHTAVRYKMLEVFFATQDRDEFVQLAKEMVESGQIDEESAEWQQARTMGRDLDKSNPLFGEEVSALEAISTISSSVLKGAEDQPEGDSEMSLDLSKLAEELDSTLNADSEPMEGLESLELDLSKFNIDAESQQAPSVDSGLSDLNVDSALAETELHTEMADMSELGDLADMAADDDSSVLVDDLADLSGELEDVMADSVILDEPLEMVDEEAGGEVSAGKDESSETPMKEVAELDNIEPESILGEESETKLELAQAYMEMGDREGALSILLEVEEDGTDNQKGEASRMLSELNN